MTETQSEEARIDKVNLLDYIESNCQTDKILYLRIIQDATASYLYAFLGKNSTDPEEFFSAWKYFFKTESTNKKSWDHNRTIRLSYTSKGNKIVRKHYLTDDELRLMCFDKHYEFSGLAEYMHIDKFRNGLKAKRTKILNNNWEKIKTYINALYQNELDQIEIGRQVPLQVWDDNLISILTDPPSPSHLASIIYVSNKLKKPIKPKSREQTNVGMYITNVQRIKSSNPQSLDINWGPLATLIEIENDKISNSNIGNY